MTCILLIFNSFQFCVDEYNIYNILTGGFYLFCILSIFLVVIGGLRLKLILHNISNNGKAQLNVIYIYIYIYYYIDIIVIC